MAIFDKEHYKVIAKELNYRYRLTVARQSHGKGETGSPSEIKNLVYQLADVFAEDNNNFNRDKFLQESLAE